MHACSGVLVATAIISWSSFIELLSYLGTVLMHYPLNCNRMLTCMLPRVGVRSNIYDKNYRPTPPDPVNITSATFLQQGPPSRNDHCHTNGSL
jgi:hypothetical protein